MGRQGSKKKKSKDKEKQEKPKKEDKDDQEKTEKHEKSSNKEGKHEKEKSKEKESKKKLEDTALVEEVSRALIELVPKIQAETKKTNFISKKLDRIEQRKECLERKTGHSQMVWRIDNFQERLDQAKQGQNTVIYSPPFKTHAQGYKIMVSLCPNGDGKAKGEFMSVFFCIMQGEHDALLPWPFSLPITFTVAAPSEELSLDREVTSQVVREAPPAACVSVTFTPQPTPQLNNYLGRPLNMRNSSLGIPRFMKIEDLWEAGFILDDSLFIKVSVDHGSAPLLP